MALISTSAIYPAMLEWTEENTLLIIIRTMDIILERKYLTYTNGRTLWPIKDKGSKTVT